eukprot:CAMPEP_0201592534 /NCGR_PEP_ID=MMETSP0190_2-20130828/190403_1 /ASSEMBLY_ACC=CAM_ASM_000263 /TAXON_ID=37353 /ORGANISM="Rosalina sp." /LENGTH=119 /DNA_ID=CAMNT_0048051349 /DNA_START=72 /DNA_END=432 /DNA_ORIENTATION=+
MMKSIILFIGLISAINASSQRILNQATCATVRCASGTFCTEDPKQVFNVYHVLLQPVQLDNHVKKELDVPVVVLKNIIHVVVHVLQYVVIHQLEHVLLYVLKDASVKMDILEIQMDVVS